MAHFHVNWKGPSEGEAEPIQLHIRRTGFAVTKMRGMGL